MIDVTFSMLTDSSGVDPDDLRTGSPTLRRFHQTLWSRPAAGTGEVSLQWHADSTTAYLWHQSEELGRFAVGSDTIATSHSAYSRFQVSALYRKVDPDRREQFHSICSTVGAYLVFPVHQQSINQRRGAPPLCDRFDLAQGCIRRHYEEPDAPNPLGSVLARNGAFFNLFADFRGYVSFFYLDPLVDAAGSVKPYLSGFDGSLTKTQLPVSESDYLDYLDRQEAFVAARNQLIADDFVTSSRDKPAAWPAQPATFE